jgi:hypothetical protein
MTPFPYSRQEAFDIAYKGIIEQGGPSWDINTSSCRYRTKNGRKCAIGHLIPDNKYSEEFENGQADHVLEQIYTIRDGDHQFYCYLQRVHDVILEGKEGISDGEFLYEFSIRMSDFAERYNLAFPPAPR